MLKLHIAREITPLKVLCLNVTATASTGKYRVIKQTWKSFRWNQNWDHFIPLRIHRWVYNNSNACPSMNLNSPFICITIKFQIACCAIVSGTSPLKFIKEISCWGIALGTSREIFFCKLWTKFGESTTETEIWVKMSTSCANVLYWSNWFCETCNCF